MTSASNDEIHVISVGEQGPAGARGVDGFSGDTTYDINFSWNDVTSKFLVNVPADKLILSVGIHISEVFDGAVPALKVGDGTVSDRLFKSTENDPKSLGEYSVSPSYSYTFDTDLYLSITPGAGCDQGKGVVRIQVQH